MLYTNYKATREADVAHGMGETPAVVCRGLWKVYGDERRVAHAAKKIGNGSVEPTTDQQLYNCFAAVQDVSFAVRRGETFCVMGLSGSGKSTLIRNINKLIAPTAGDVLIEGESISKMGRSALRYLRSHKIGMVFQSSALLPHRTAGENVTLSLELRGESRKKRAMVEERMLDLVGLTGWGNNNCSELSGGMQQRIGLARALAGDPSILLMDEPFSALDPLIRQQLQGEFKRLSSSIGKTTLFITHDLDEAIRLGDRIAIMKGGRIVQIGTPEQIVTDPADDYVKSFVQGISRVHLVTARTIMKPLANEDEAHVSDATPLKTLPRAHANDDLNTLLNLYITHESPIIVEQDDEDIGLINIMDLLSALRDTGEVCRE